MDDLRVNRVPQGGITGIGDGSRQHRGQPNGQERQQPGEQRRTPDELAFLLRRAKVADSTLVDTRVEMTNEDGNLRVRIVDAISGEVVGEMSGEELARLAREAHVTTGILGEWRQ